MTQEDYRHVQERTTTAQETCDQVHAASEEDAEGEDSGHGGKVEKEVTAMHRGLCETCSYAREIVPATGSRFLMCEKSQKDRRYHKYPPQPIIRCDGYENGQPRSQGIVGEEAG